MGRFWRDAAIYIVLHVEAACEAAPIGIFGYPYTATLVSAGMKPAVPSMTQDGHCLPVIMLAKVAEQIKPRLAKTLTNVAVHTCCDRG